MKFKCDRHDLATHLSLVLRAVPSRPTHPIFASILVKCSSKDQRVTLTAFDLSMGIKTSFPAEVSKGDSTTLPAKLLGDIVQKLPNVSLQFQSDSAHQTVINALSGKYTMQGTSPEDFTELPALKGAPVELPAELFLDGIRNTLFAASTDEHKQALTGIRFSILEDSIEFAATDGHRLSVTKLDIPEDSDVEPFAITIPGRSLRELERIVATANPGTMVSIMREPEEVSFTVGETLLTSRTLNGQYPEYRQLIPRQFEQQLTVDRRSLLGALERLSILANQKSNHLVLLDFTGTGPELNLSSDAQEVGCGNETLGDVQVQGDGMAIGFNVKYLIDSLKVLPSTEIQVRLNTPTSPVVVAPLGGMKATHLIMPVQIRS